MSYKPKQELPCQNVRTQYCEGFPGAQQSLPVFHPLGVHTGHLTCAVSQLRLSLPLTEIGVGITGFGVFFILFGILLYFDSVLLAFGNVSTPARGTSPGKPGGSAPSSLDPGHSGLDEDWGLGVADQSTREHGEPEVITPSSR